FRAVEPREIALLRLAAGATHRPVAFAGPREEDPAISRRVEDHHAAGASEDRAEPARERGPVDRERGGALRPREPDRAPRRQHETLERLPAVRERLPRALAVHDRDGSAVVERRRMVEEGDAIASERHARVADPPRRLVERPAGRELEALLSRNSPHDRELFTV